MRKANGGPEFDLKSVDWSRLRVGPIEGLESAQAQVEIAKVMERDEAAAERMIEEWTSRPAVELLREAAALLALEKQCRRGVDLLLGYAEQQVGEEAMRALLDGLVEREEENRHEG